MAKIQYIKAWGLWSHWETVTEYAPGLTVVTGPNDGGKSTIIRIIKWVFLGEPSGEEFLFTKRNESGEVIKAADEGKAEIGLDNEIVITKTRRKGKTTYSISTISEPFEKAEVPDEIKDALGIKIYNYGDFKTYLNFSFQHDAPFLLSEAPSVGAKVLGKLAGTEVVDLAISDITKRAHKTRTEKIEAEKQITKLNGDLLDYLDLEDKQKAVEACEMLLGEVEANSLTVESLKTLAQNLQRAAGLIKKHEADLEDLKEVDKLKNDLNALEKAQLKYSLLNELYGQLIKHESVALTLTDQLALYKDIGAAASILGELENSFKRYTDMNSLTTFFKNYTQIINTSNILLEKLVGVDNAVAILENMTVVNGKLERLTENYSRLKYLDRTIDIHTTALEPLKKLDDVQEPLKALEEKAERRNTLGTIQTKLLAYDYAVDKLEEAVNSFSMLGKASKDLKDLESLNKRIDALRAINKSYTENTFYHNRLKGELLQADMEYKAAESELQQAWEEAGGVCPLCDQPVLTHSH